MSVAALVGLSAARCSPLLWLARTALWRCARPGALPWLPVARINADRAAEGVE